MPYSTPVLQLEPSLHLRPGGRHGRALLEIRVGSPRFGRRREATARASGAYTPLHFGLGSAAKVDSVEVVWSEGQRQTSPGPPADRAYRVSRHGGLMEGLAGPK